MAVGATLRLIGLDWDHGQHLHPDERFLSMVLVDIQPTANALTYFDPATSPLNPFNHGIDFFVYGTFPLFLVDSIARVLDRASYDDTYLVGRVLSALFDTGTIAVVFLLGRRLFGIWTGLVAASLMACAAHSIQIAHFFTVDTFATFFVTSSIWLMSRFADLRNPRDLTLAGIAIGLAMASKLSSGLLILLFLGWWSYVGIREHLFSGRWNRCHVWPLQAATLLAFAALTFRLFQPYAFRYASPFDWRLSPTFTSALTQQHAIQTGELDWPPGIQWAGTAPLLYPIEQIIRWGVGPAFGIAAFIGLALAMIVWWKSGHHPLAIPIVWTVLNFAVFGTFVLKTMRYFHPIYPMLALVTAWTFIWLWRGGRKPWLKAQRHRRLAIGCVLSAVLGASVLWALAFVQIYGRDHSRVAASAFIYEHVPHGSSIVVEHWDDALPLRLQDRDPSRYKIRELRVFDQDSESKRRELIEVLGSADLVILASDRGAATIPRIPQRYPLTRQYYQALVDGSLGFELLATFRSQPSLGPWLFDDRDAEEAFTVYDHPTVSLYRPRTDQVADDVRHRLSTIDIRGASNVLPKAATSRSTNLPDQETATITASASWPTQFVDRPIHGFAAMLAWFASVWIAGLITWPLTWLALRRLPDRGYAAARVLGPAALLIPGWWFASLGIIEFKIPAIILSALLVTMFSIGLLWPHRHRFFRSITKNAGTILLTEALMVIAFVVMSYIRAQNPDLWHPVFGGEKPMDFAHLNAVLRSPSFPPYDPWYAGSRLNYYYFGHVPTAALAKTLGIVPSVVYNLAIASAFSAAIVAVFAAASSLWTVLSQRSGEAIAAGLSAIALILIAGNLHPALQLISLAQHSVGSTSIGVLAAPSVVLSGKLARDFDFWAPTRVIPNTVNEFPWFTFLYGDLHPHLMNFANTGVSLIGSVGILAVGEQMRHRRTSNWRLWVGSLVLPTFVLALHRVTNPWDFPTYAVVTIATLVYALWRSSQYTARTIGAITGCASVALFVVSQLLFWPFHSTYVDFFSGIALTPETTLTASWLVMFGAPIAILITYSVLTLAHDSKLASANQVFKGPLFSIFTIASLSIVAMMAVTFGWSVGTLAGGLILVGGMAAWRSRNNPTTLAPLALLLAGISLTMIPEFVVIRDDIGRLNTVFKTYLQAWMLLGLGAALALPALVRHIRRIRVTHFAWLQTAWAAVIGMVAITAFAYPFLATPHKLGLRIQPLKPTLNGEAYLTGGQILDQGVQINLTADYRAITWLRNNIVGAPTLAETPTTIYRWGGRISVYTGLPSIIAWDWHAKQQHWGYAHEVEARFNDARELFTTRNVQRAETLLSTLGVELIYVGELERALYPAEALAKFDRMKAMGVHAIYRDGTTVIYRLSKNFQLPPVG